MSTELILLVDANTPRRERTAFAIEDHGGYRVEAVGTLAEARKELADPALTGIICDAGEHGDEGIELLREVRDNPRVASLPFVLMTNPASSEARIDGWVQSADAVVSQPIHPAELLACFAACARRRTRRKDTSHPATRQLDLSVNRTQRLLVTLLDAVVPGAGFRGAEATALAGRLADEFDVPPDLRGDLERAARLHELGRLVAEPVPATDQHVVGAGVSAAILTASGVLLEPLPGMGGTAELISGMAANWDGTGYPSHLEHGEIPMRSRILRVAVDYLAAIHAAGGDGIPLNACEKLSLQSGTSYDPAVLSTLLLIVSQENPVGHGFSTEAIRVDRLTEGLVLVDDLCTASGVKLLSAGAVLTATSLRLIAERHVSDPIVHAVATRRQEQ